MVYALEELDCSNKLKEIFKILFYETWESKQHAYSILSEQIFTFRPADMLEIIAMWDDINLYPNKCPNCNDNETIEMIQDAIDGYKGYLNSESEKDKKTNENV